MTILIGRGREAEAAASQTAAAAAAAAAEPACLLGNFWLPQARRFDRCEHGATIHGLVILETTA